MYYCGADPEVFVGNASGVKSIIGRIGGTKEAPLALPIGEGFAVQEDNVALEFNIPASPTKEAFVSNITKARNFLAQAMMDMHGLDLMKMSSISFPAEELQHPDALRFGCDPDFNAWTGRRNPRPKAADANLRSCGGHVHIGIKGTPFEGLDTKRIIQAMDVFCGIPSVLLDEGDLRKQLYGKAGAYREKPYGCEYRSMSNFWIFDEQLTAMVYDNTGRALESVLNGVCFDEHAMLIQRCINENDKDLARDLVGRFNLSLA